MHTRNFIDNHIEKGIDIEKIRLRINKIIDNFIHVLINVLGMGMYHQHGIIK